MMRRAYAEPKGAGQEDGSVGTESFPSQEGSSVGIHFYNTVSIYSNPVLLSLYSRIAQFSGTRGVKIVKNGFCNAV